MVKTYPFEDHRPGAYRWFYFDAIAPEGDRALVAIFFIGSVFSPYYARRLRAGENPLPVEHYAINLALYRRGERPTFVFSEYGRSAGTLHEDDGGVPQSMTVGRSRLQRDGDRIRLHVDDRRVGLRSAIRGDISVEPLEPPLGRVALADKHGWRAHAPRTRVSARIGDFKLDGLGYHDENWGLEPPARAFARWSWGRVHDGARTRIFFDLERRDRGAPPREHLVFDSREGDRREPLPPRRVAPSLASYLLPLPETYDVGPSAAGARLLTEPSWMIERAPFYLRFLAPFPPSGALGMAEHVDFDRIETDVVRRMVSLRVARPERGDYGILP